MIKEIGGEFYFTADKSYCALPDKSSVSGMLRQCDALWLDSGRSAILHFYNCCVSPAKLLLPAYCCRSMTQGIPDGKVDFYDVNIDLSIDIESLREKLSVSEAKAVLFINYFGFLQPQRVLEVLSAAQRAGILIFEDTTHSFFTAKSTVGDYCVCSFRKWFALQCGAAFYSTARRFCGETEKYPANKALFEARTAALNLKGEYMCGKNKDKERYLALFKEGEEMLNRQTMPCAASGEAQAMLRCESRGDIIAARRSNFLYMQEHIHGVGLQSVKRLCDAVTVPMFFPVYSDRRDELRQTLIQNDIFCPVHWPEFEHVNLKYSKKARCILDHILSLPVDQRYSVVDMARIAEVVNSFCKIKSE
jgi:hypothetical protein